MRVAMLGPFPGAEEVTGGVDAVVRALAEGLAARPDVDLHVITAVPGIRTTRIERIGRLTLQSVPHPYRDRLLWHQPVVRQLRSALKSVAPDVAHAHMGGIYADAALQWGGPAVVALHGVVFREAALALSHSALSVRMRWQLDALYERWVVRRARDLIAISPYIAQEYRPLTRARFHDIENPVEDRFFDVPAASLQAFSDGAGPRLLCVARVIPRKDILTLIRTFARVRESFPTAELEIVGREDVDLAYTSACREAIGQLGLGNSVRFLGSVFGAELAACYGRADLILLTSRQETAPVAVAEAMAAGRPVVATAVGGVPFMMADGQTGLLAQPGDVARLAEAALSLLRDPARRLAYGDAARDAARRRFSLFAVVERTVALYRTLSR